MSSNVINRYHFVIDKLSNVINVENPFVSARIPVALNKALEARIKTTGESRSKILVNALCDYLEVQAGDLSTAERLKHLEARTAALEQTVFKSSNSSSENISAKNLENLTKDQLIKIAKGVGVYSYKLDREGLIEAILHKPE